jgi:NAD(P)-dependent dehydrogenase (short-subunit alcohol dehydrogenase family)
MERLTIRTRLSRALHAARRELRSPAPPIWKLVDPRAASERFDGRVVVVTGAAGLIGSVLTESFLAAGATVHALDRDADGLAAVAAAPAGAAAGGRLVVHGVDMADPAAIESFGRSIDRVDIVINNVGWNDDRQGVAALDADSWRKALDVNLVGPALLTQALWDRLATSEAAAVVFVTSINAVATSPWLHYSAAKAGVAKLVVDLAHDAVLDGIRVNAVGPGHVRDRADPADRRAVTPLALAGGTSPVEAIVHAVLFLADVQTSPMTTGQHLLITGAPERGGLIARPGR